MSYFRKCVDVLEGYVPGEQPTVTQRVIKLNTNENPYAPSPKVRAAIAAELGSDGERLRLYSDPSAKALVEAAAARFGFPASGILPGNGSDELLALLIRAMVEPGETIAYPYPTYVLYKTLAGAQGAQVRTVDFDDSYTLPEQLFGESARLVFVASPNAPSGNSHPTSQLKKLAKSLDGGVLVIDEAYADFASDNALQLANELDNVVVLRTFSKSHSLAGMRVGLLFASEAIVSGLRKVKDSYNLDRLAIVAAAASLSDPEWTENNLRKIIATRARLSERLRALGLRVDHSDANFVLAHLPSADAAKAAYMELKAQGILVRHFALRRLDDALRISVGTDEEVDAFLDAFERWLAS